MKMEFTYEKCISPYKSNYKVVKILGNKVKELSDFVNEIILVKSKEYHHVIDSGEEYKRFYTGFMGELALEELFGIKIMNWNIGNSNKFNYPDIPNYRVGIKTVEFPKFPIIFKNNYYPQIINIKVPDKNIVCVCGLATIEVLNKYQSDDLILSHRLRQRGTKTGFYGFSKLIVCDNIDVLLPYKK